MGLKSCLVLRRRSEGYLILLKQNSLLRTVSFQGACEALQLVHISDAGPARHNADAPIQIYTSH